ADGELLLPRPRSGVGRQTRPRMAAQTRRYPGTGDVRLHSARRECRADLHRAFGVHVARVPGEDAGAELERKQQLTLMPRLTLVPRRPGVNRSPQKEKKLHTRWNAL